MAKKRKSAKRRRRVRRVGAFKLGGKDTGLKLAALAGGFLLGKPINDFINKMNITTTAATADSPAVSSTRVNPTFITVGEIGLGGLLLLRKSNGTVGAVTKVVGGVLAGAGVRRAFSQMGIMSGYQSVPVIGRHRMAGYQSVPVIGQKGTPPQLAGKTPAQLQGYRVNGYKPAGSGVGVMGAIGTVDGGSGSGITTSCGSGYMG